VVQHDIEAQYLEADLVFKVFRLAALHQVEYMRLHHTKTLYNYISDPGLHSVELGNPVLGLDDIVDIS